MANLDSLRQQLVREIEVKLGRKIYTSFDKGKPWWGLYSTNERDDRDRQKGNFGFVQYKKRPTKWLTGFPRPHLQVAVNNNWVVAARLTPDEVNPNGWFATGESEAYWCIYDNGTCKHVAEYLAQIYRSRKL